MRSVLLFSFLTFCFVGYGQIINFSDVNFKNALVNTLCVDTDGDNIGDSDADINEDGEIDVEEALQIKRLDVSSQNIISLERIEEFKNLESLLCGYNKLTSIDLKELLKLAKLNLRSNQITALELQTLINLERLELSNNQLNTLNLSPLRKVLK